MFRWLASKFKPMVVREGVTKDLKELLFPELESVVENGNTYLINHSVDVDLECALYDLEDAEADEVCLETIRRAIGKLKKARELLQADSPIDPYADYVILKAD